VATTSRVDGVYLDEDQHFAIGEALALEMKNILS
jgi:hypothetical protein